MDFFHFQDLVTPDYGDIRFYVPLDNFERSATPASKAEYVKYREKVLKFIEGRNRRMADWDREHTPTMGFAGSACPTPP